MLVIKPCYTRSTYHALLPAGVITIISWY